MTFNRISLPDSVGGGGREDDAGKDVLSVRNE